jgi:hypothetical protein
MVRPDVLPPTAFKAAVLYSLYFMLPAYQKTKKSARATESGAPLNAAILIFEWFVLAFRVIIQHGCENIMDERLLICSSAALWCLSLLASCEEYPAEEACVFPAKVKILNLSALGSRGNEVGGKKGKGKRYDGEERI